MKNILFYLFLFFLAINFAGCNRHACDRIKNIYTIWPFNNPIPFDSLHSVASTINYLEYQSCVVGDTAFPVIYYNFRKEKIVKSSWGSMEVGIEPIPCFGDLEYDFNQVLEIQLDGNNILIEGKRMPLDSVSKYVFYQYLNYGQMPGFSKWPEGNGIWLITEKSRSMNDFNQILGEVLKGYREAFLYLSNGLFGDNPCKISQDEWEILSNKMQFRLAIKYSDEEKPILQTEDAFLE